jgi:hypothetical protein
METYTALKEFVDDPRFPDRRRAALCGLDRSAIDEPIRPLIAKMAELPYCFTLQSCCGHFVFDGRDPTNIEPLPRTNGPDLVEYRIAYCALCIERSEEGLRLYHDLGKIPAIDPSCIQFGCAEWFWRRQVNTFVLQVEPERYRDRDAVTIGIDEARYIETVRDAFITRLDTLIDERVAS